MNVVELNSELGYTELFMGPVKLVSRYNFIIHCVSIDEIEEIVKDFKEVLDLATGTAYEKLCRDELSEIETLTRTFLPSRKKKGMVTMGGSLLKFLFGTMDDEDRKSIEAQLRAIDENNHNLIENANQQVIINENFNKSISQIKDLIKDDRIKILERLDKVNSMHKQLVKEDIAIGLLFKIRILKDKAQAIQQAIASTKLGLFQPNLLSQDEIEKFDINFNSLQHIKLVLAEYGDNKLNFIIMIPNKRF